MSRFRQVLAQIPGLKPLYRNILRALEARRLRRMSTEEVFASIFKTNYWGGATSRSGSGSDTEQVRVLIEALPVLFSEFQIRSVLDIPCGDFHWMKGVELEGIAYIGADVVSDVVQENQRRYGNAARRFLSLNVLRDPLPPVDLILCRDCLVHFSLNDARRALDNLRMGGARYLLATTFPERSKNSDIATGQWRPLNLQASPFNLPPPLRLISEHCREEQGAYSDKSLGLWSVSQLRSLTI